MMNNTPPAPRNTNDQEVTVKEARDVLMGDIVTVKGARYIVNDEPRYVTRSSQQYVRWALIPADERGVLRGDYDELAVARVNVG